MFVNNSCHAQRLSRLIKPKTNGKTGPQSVSDNRLRFPRKSIVLQHIFFLTQCSSIQDNHLIMGKDAKDKGKGKTPFQKDFRNAPDLQQMPSLSKAFGQTKSLCCFRQGFFCLTKWSFFFLLWAGFLCFLYPRTFFCF